MTTPSLASAAEARIATLPLTIEAGLVSGHNAATVSMAEASARIAAAGSTWVFREDATPPNRYGIALDIVPPAPQQSPHCGVTKAPRIGD